MFFYALDPTTIDASTLKPVVFDPSYGHTKYAPTYGEQDVMPKFRAYTTCFDGPDDGDGFHDKWAVPH